MTNYFSQNYCRELDAKSTKDATGKSVKRKQKTLEHRKSLPGRGSDSDDDFKPTKAVARVNKEKPRTKPVKAKDEDNDSLPPTLPNKRPAKKLESKDSDSDLEFVIKPAAKKRTVKPGHSGSDVEVKPKLAAKGKAKEKEVPAPKRKRYGFLFLRNRSCLC
jgi:DNA topoisomerase-2